MFKRSVQVKSRFNPQLKLKNDFFDPKIYSGGLIQSGGVIKDIWRPVISQLDLKKLKNTLILGMGGGTLVGILKSKEPELTITAVEIDPKMIEIAKKYFKIEKFNLKIINHDAVDFVEGRKDKFDLIFVDLYLGSQFPKSAETRKFLSNVKKILKTDGIAVFNRLYWGIHKKEAEEYMEKLAAYFPYTYCKTVPRLFATNLMIFAHK